MCSALTRLRIPFPARRGGPCKGWGAAGGSSEPPRLFALSSPYESKLSTGPKDENSRSQSDQLLFFAEREGFEPPERCRSTVFKTAVIDHSTTSPSPVRDCKYRYNFLFVKYYRRGLSSELSAAACSLSEDLLKNLHWNISR